MRLKGKTAVVTGASQGLGLSIVEHLLREGAETLICARSSDQLAQASQTIESHGLKGLTVVRADISNENDMAEFVRSAGARFEALDILICNAGVYGPKGGIEEVDWQSWVEAININLIGTVLCCRLFLPLLKKSRRGKVIVISGGGATKPLPFLSAYAASKAAVVRFAETLAEEWKEIGIDVNSVAPGALNTRLLEEVLEAGPEKVGRAFFEASLKQKSEGGTPLSAGAELCTFLASDESNGITGKLISAVWDPWAEFPQHSKELAGSDIYTLRRIVPSDRSLSWS